MIQDSILQNCLLQLERKSKSYMMKLLLKAENCSNATPKILTSQRRDKRTQEQTQNTRRKEAPDMTEIMTLIQRTMKTLAESYFNEQQQHKSDPFGYVINIINKSFTYNDFKLLVKNLNSLPDHDRYNKHTLEKTPMHFPQYHFKASHFGNRQSNYIYLCYKPKSNKSWLTKLRSLIFKRDANILLFCNQLHLVIGKLFQITNTATVEKLAIHDVMSKLDTTLREPLKMLQLADKCKLEVLLELAKSKMVVNTFSFQ